jgi:hypothetical protein
MEREDVTADLAERRLARRQGPVGEVEDAEAAGERQLRRHFF